MPHEKEDHFIFDLVENPKAKTGKSPRVTSPNSVIRIHDVNELKAQLKHYGRPFIKLQLPDTTFARKFYVEKVRPALRYYCMKFSVSIPDWLKDDHYFENLPDSEKKSLFGTTDLSIKEFQPLPKFAGGQNMGG